MKKILMILIVATTSLSACGDKEKPEPQNVECPTNTSIPALEYKDDFPEAVLNTYKDQGFDFSYPYDTIYTGRLKFKLIDYNGHRVISADKMYKDNLNLPDTYDNTQLFFKVYSNDVMIHDFTRSIASIAPANNTSYLESYLTAGECYKVYCVFAKDDQVVYQTYFDISF